MTDQRFQAQNGAHPKVHLPEDQRVYAVGDIHGRLDLLLLLLDLIREDIATQGPARNVVVFLGDYIDRGPQSAGVIDLLESLTLPDAECVFLMGNHEKYMIDLMAEGGATDRWFENGGIATLESYGIDHTLEADPLTENPIGAALWHALPNAHKTFLGTLKSSWRAGDVFFAHAGVDPDRPIDDQRTEDLIWIREAFLNSEKDHGPLIVHGHTPHYEPEVLRNRINVDTFAWQSNHLTAVVLENGQCRFLST